MSNRKLDKNNRWRNKRVSFRMSPEENELLDSYVRMSGLEKQESSNGRLFHSYRQNSEFSEHKSAMFFADRIDIYYESVVKKV